MKKNRRLLLLIITVTILLSIIIFVSATDKIWAERFYVNESGHSAIEMLGALSAIYMAFILFQRKQNTKNRIFYFPALGVLGMGILNTFHAMTSPGQSFVYLHSLAGLLGGLGFALSWLPESKISLTRNNKWAWIIVGITILGGIITIIIPEWVPVMVENSEFTTTAMGINLIAGVLYLSAALSFWRNFYRTGSSVDYQFMCLALLLGGAGIVFQYSLLWDTGWWFWHGLKLLAFLTVLGYTISIQMRETSEHRRMEAALRESEEQYHSLFSNIPTAVFRSTIDGRLLSVNPALVRILGYDSIDDIMSINTAEIYSDPEQRKVLIEQIHQKGNVDNFEMQALCKDGRKLVFLISIYATFDSNGSIKWLDGTGQNITERKQNEDAIEEWSKRYNTAIKASGLIIYDWDYATDKVVFGGCLKLVLGYTQDEMSGGITPYQNLIHPDDQEAFNILNRQLFKTRENTIGTYRILKKNGEYSHIEDSAEIILDSKGNPTHVIGFLKDITARIKAEQNKIDFEKQILQTQKLESLGVLAGGIAHDFNNILMGILGYADLALSDMDTTAPARKFVQGINDSTLKAADLVKQMLAYSGKGKFSLEPIDLNHLIEDSIQMLKISISKSTVLKFNYSQEPVFTEGDPSQIRQIIMNLVINASEAIEKESGIVTITTDSMYADSEDLKGSGFGDPLIRDQQLPEGMYAFIEISDTGTGISKDIISKIFEPFFTTKFIGRGLGLSAVQGIVRGHHGLMKIYSEENIGTTFKILFPLYEESPKRYSKNDSSATINNSWEGKGTILIAEDEESVQSVTKYMLSKMGFDVLTADDGREAIELYNEHSDKIICILLDLTMPHKDGAEVFQEIRKLNPSVKVILSSGYNEQDATQQFIGKGLAGFLQKPFTAAKLSKKVREVLGDLDNYTPS